MVIYNAATRELTAKIVYYGPGLGGKTTNLQLLHERLEPATVGKLLNLATQTDRTIYFDLLPVELGDIKGYKIRFQLATVPGQTAFNETRRVVLKGTDGIVFVADSQWTMLPKNLESWQNLKENLRANGVSFEGIPIVIQYNKRDLTDILSVDALQEALGLSSYPFVEAVASAGRGVTETFKLISKLTFVDLLRRLQGRKPDEPGTSLPRREPDDLLSWKDSLLNRGAAPGIGEATNASAKRPLTLVPSLPEEAPFAAAEEPSAVEASVPEEAGAPFGDAANPPAMSASPSPSVPAEAGSTAPMPVVEASAPVAQTPPAEPLANEPPAPEPQTAPAPPVAFDDLAVPAMPEISPVLVSGWDPDASLPKSPFVEPPSVEAPSVEAPSAEAPSVAAAEIAAPPPPPAAAASVAPVAPDAPPTGEAFAALTDDTDARIRALEARLDEALAAIAREHEERSRTEESRYALRGRLEALESESRALGKTVAEKQTDLVGRFEKLAEAGQSAESASRASITEMQEMLAASEKRQRISEDDVAMALRSFGERGEKIHQQVGAIASQIEVLEAAIREKTAQSRREADDIRSELATIKNAIEEKIGQGRREAEDIRSQLSPLLEAHQQRAATDERLSQEFDRLRESLAESLGDLSERLRRAVRGL
jgi:signal recognition particle receptor subunit beta